jgi:transcriptional regulator with XRE-family HTH domain
MEVQQLADTVGISANYLRKVERGVRTRMRPGPFSRLKAALNANETELLAPHPNPPERK